jgi:hypothetical protein
VTSYRFDAEAGRLLLRTLNAVHWLRAAGAPPA